MAVYQFRNAYQGFCTANNIPDSELPLVTYPKGSNTPTINARLKPLLEQLVRGAQEDDKNGGSGGSGGKDPFSPETSGTDKAMDAFEKEFKSGGSGTEETTTTTTAGKDKDKDKTKTKTKTTQASKQAVNIGPIAHEWWVMEAIVLGNDNQTNANGNLDLDHAALQQANMRSYRYMPSISSFVEQQASGGGGYVAEGTGTTGLSSLVGVSEADIILGIVDWTIKRAKEELLKAFLQEWLTRIQNSTLLREMFPQTLNLLATTDLTTIISQGNVWKAAFKADLDALPGKLPAVVQIVLDKIPDTRLKPSAKKEIVGVTTLVSDLYVSLRTGNNLEDAMAVTCKKLTLKAQNDLSIVERGFMGAEAFLQATVIMEGNKRAVLNPLTILSLNAGEMKDFWNMLFIRQKDKLLKVFNVSENKAKDFYNKVCNKLDEIQSVLGQVADLQHDINRIIEEAKKNTANKQKMTATDLSNYYDLVMKILNEGTSIVQSLGLDTGKIAEVKSILENVVKPLADNVATIVEGVATKQYGQVISGGISVLRLLATEVVSDPDLALIASVIEDAKALLDRIKSGDLASDILADARKIVKALATKYKNAKDKDDHAAYKALNTAVAALDQITGNDMNTIKKELKKALSTLVDDLLAAAEKLDSGEWLQEIAQYLNGYGRFIVNVLSAENSDEVKKAFDDAAMKTGSYMVKQTSKCALTVTFMPGAGGFYETLQPTADAVADGNDLSTDEGSATIGAVLPIGMEFSLSVGKGKGGAVGIYGQVADLGAVLNYRLTGSDSVSSSPNVTFRQVLSPGAYLVYHFPKIPLLVGGGVNYSPQLRDIATDQQTTFQANSVRWGGFLAVDVTVFQVFASRRKRGPNFISVRKAKAGK